MYEVWVAHDLVGHHLQIVEKMHTVYRDQGMAERRIEPNTSKDVGVSRVDGFASKREKMCSYVCGLDNEEALFA